MLEVCFAPVALFSVLDCMNSRLRAEGAVLAVWPEKREMFFSRSLVDINLQKQPELGETQAILV